MKKNSAWALFCVSFAFFSACNQPSPPRHLPVSFTPQDSFGEPFLQVENTQDIVSLRNLVVQEKNLISSWFKVFKADSSSLDGAPGESPFRFGLVETKSQLESGTVIFFSPVQVYQSKEFLEKFGETYLCSQVAEILENTLILPMRQVGNLVQMGESNLEQSKISSLGLTYPGTEFSGFLLDSLVSSRGSQFVFRFTNQLDLKQAKLKSLNLVSKEYSSGNIQLTHQLEGRSASYQALNTKSQFEFSTDHQFIQGQSSSYLELPVQKSNEPWRQKILLKGNKTRDGAQVFFDLDYYQEFHFLNDHEFHWMVLYTDKQPGGEVKFERKYKVTNFKIKTDDCLVEEIFL